MKKTGLVRIRVIDPQFLNKPAQPPRVMWSGWLQQILTKNRQVS